MSQSKSRVKLWSHINGATGAQILTAGGTLGTGNIAFTANPTAADTITVNDTVFTFVSTASTATNINIKGTLALTLAEAESVIQANSTVGVGSGVIVNVDVTDTDSDLTFRFHPNAEVTTFESSTDGANTTDTAFSAGTVAPVIDITKSNVILEWADASSALTYLAIPNGTFDGQMVKITAASVATSGDSVGVIGTFADDDTLLTIGASTFAAGEGCTLYWNDAAWNIMLATDAAKSNLEAAAL